MKNEYLFATCVIAACVGYWCCGCGSNKAELEKAARAEQRVIQHSLDLAKCRDQAYALDAGPKERWWQYTICADTADRAYGVQP